MKINALTGSFSDLSAQLRRPEGAEATGGAAAALSAAPADVGAPLREIVGRYDVANISPRELSEMLDGLHREGYLSDSQFHELSQMRLDLETEGVEPDEKIDLVDFYRDLLRQLQEQQQGDGEANGLPPWQEVEGRLEWAQKFALMQSERDSIGLDLAA